MRGIKPKAVVKPEPIQATESKPKPPPVIKKESENVSLNYRNLNPYGTQVHNKFVKLTSTTMFLDR